MDNIFVTLTLAKNLRRRLPGTHGHSVANIYDADNIIADTAFRQRSPSMLVASTLLRRGRFWFRSPKWSSFKTTRSQKPCQSRWVTRTILAATLGSTFYFSLPIASLSIQQNTFGRMLTTDHGERIFRCNVQAVAPHKKNGSGLPSREVIDFNAAILIAWAMHSERVPTSSR